jgi:hypothetical protein
VKIAIHQPNFLPWPGYFYKMSLCDTFVFLDDVEINSKSYTRRVKIRHQALADKSRWFTVPLEKHSDSKLIKEIKIDQSKDWIQNQQAILHNTYFDAPNWSKYQEWINNLYTQCDKYELLSEMNMFLVKEIANKLNIKCNFQLSSHLPVSGKADTYTYNIVKHLEGDVYIRGKGEQRYSRNSNWQTDSEIEVLNISYDTFIHDDHTGSWKSGYSIIDWMMYVGEPTPTLP